MAGVGFGPGVWSPIAVGPLAAIVTEALRRGVEASDDVAGLVWP